MQLADLNVQDLRVFLPAKDFAVSRAFHQALGFVEDWSSDNLVLFRLGQFSFFLQDYFVQAWAENMMMDLRVADADSFWSYLQSLSATDRLPKDTPMRAPDDGPEPGIRGGSFIDPAGVLWHFSQRMVR